MSKKSTPRRINSSIKKDPINPADWMRFTLPWSCEDCTHYAYDSQLCTLGYKTEPHRREEHLKSYQMSGKIAVCRFQEID